MGPEYITLMTEAGPWTAFKRVQVSASLDEAARSWQMEAAFEVGAGLSARLFKAGAKVTITSNGSVLLQGFVDRYRPSGDAKQFSLSLSGRSLSADMIDSSVIHASGHLKSVTLLDIAKAFDKSGISFTSAVPLKVIDRVQINPGETVFAVLDRYARAHRLTLTGTADGGVQFYDASTPKRHATPLIEGLNILRFSADHNWSGRYSHYVVRGQEALGTNADKLQMQSVIKDSAVADRIRPNVIIVERQSNDGDLRKRARHERDRAAGRALSASVTVQGFRDEAGLIWEPGYLVFVESTAMNVVQDMLIERVSFSQDGNGSITDIDLVDPRAYAGDKVRGSKSGDETKMSDEDAVTSPPDDQTVE